MFFVSSLFQFCMLLFVFFLCTEELCLITFAVSKFSQCLLFSVPPTKAELVGHTSGSELSVKEEEEVELKCVIHNARPRPDIIWYLGDREFVSGMC